MNMRLRTFLHSSLFWAFPAVIALAHACGAFGQSNNFAIADKAFYPTTYGTSGQCWISGGNGVLPNWAACGVSSTLTSAHLYVGNGSNVATDVALSGDCSMANTGAITCTTSSSVAIATTSGTQTLTNKRISPRIVTAADATSITPNIDTSDEIIQSNTQGLGTLTLNAATGTPVDGQKLIVRVTSTNAHALSFNAAYTGSTDLVLPTTLSGAGKADYLGFIYNSASSKWNLVAKSFGY